MKKRSSLSILLLAICMAVCLPAIAGDDELAGAWRTPEEETVIITLLLYPEDAFRLYQYDPDAKVTHMLEGVCIVEDGTITVSEVRLGILDAAGEYTQTDEMETVSYLYTIVPSDPPMLALMFDEMETYFLYPYDPDGPGDWQRQDPEDIGISLVADSVNYFKAGQVFSISLDENQSIPYRWKPEISGAMLIESVRDEINWSGATSNMPGAGGEERVFYFKALRPGECTIIMNYTYMYPDDDDEIVQTESHTIIIEQ